MTRWIRTANISDFEELLEGQSKNRTALWWPLLPKLDLEGDPWCYPVRMEDSYGVLFDCTLKYPQSTEDLTWLQPWKGPFEEKLELFKQEVAGEIQLGHTWMFSAVVPESLSEAEKENLAQQCYAALVADAVWKKDLVGTGSFLGGTVFELRVRSHEHCLLVFYPKEETAKTTVADFYQDWLHLFCYRHKILWAYRNSQSLRKVLETLVTKMEQSRTKVHQCSTPHLDDETLENLQHLLEGTVEKIYYQYATTLGQLEVQSHTIEVNLYNYRVRLSAMKDKKPGTHLECLRKFFRTGQQKHKQVQKDLTGLRPSLKMWDSLISYLRVRVGVETERRERHFQRIVSIFGVALAAGAIMASISGQFPTAIEKTFNVERINNHWLGRFMVLLLSGIFTCLGLDDKVWLSPGISVLISFGMALLAGGFTAVVIWLWPKLWKRRNKSGA